MKIHFLGGFLGSGKTTAIIAAAKYLMSQGKTVGIITNDQGKYLVDTAFFRLADLPTVEVTGGCFCCHYGDLDEELSQLIDRLHPDVIFAESVGSCADLIATVIRPMAEYRESSSVPSSYSVIVDGRLLKLLLDGDELPFSENVSYIFEKQIEESGLLVINKMDLIPASERESLLQSAEAYFSGKVILAQNSLNEDSIRAWVSLIETEGTAVPEKTLELDYEKYGAGEADLAWLDQRLFFTGAQDCGREFVIALLSSIENSIRQRGYPIGHLKAELMAGPIHAKLSFVALETPGWEELIPALPTGQPISLLLNGRVQCTANALQTLVDSVLQQVLQKYSVTMVEDGRDVFNPGFPNPTHRLGGK